MISSFLRATFVSTNPVRPAAARRRTAAAPVPEPVRRHSPDRRVSRRPAGTAAAPAVRRSRHRRWRKRPTSSTYSVKWTVRKAWRFSFGVCLCLTVAAPRRYRPACAATAPRCSLPNCIKVLPLPATRTVSAHALPAGQSQGVRFFGVDSPYFGVGVLRFGSHISCSPYSLSESTEMRQHLGSPRRGETYDEHLCTKRFY